MLLSMATTRRDKNQYAVEYKWHRSVFQEEKYAVTRAMCTRKTLVKKHQ